MGTPRVSRGVHGRGIQASGSLEGYVADGRFSLAGLLKPNRTRDFTFAAQDAQLDDGYFRPSFPLRRTTEFTSLHCPIDPPATQSQVRLISEVAQGKQPERPDLQIDFAETAEASSPVPVATGGLGVGSASGSGSGSANERPTTVMPMEFFAPGAGDERTAR
jgi:hypothetical protein